MSKLSDARKGTAIKRLVKKVRRPASGNGRRASAGSSSKPLTARELEILLLFAQGLDSVAIARRLSISRATARNHGQRILAKLRVHSRLAAVRLGYARRMIPIPAAE